MYKGIGWQSFFLQADIQGPVSCVNWGLVPFGAEVIEVQA